MTFLTSIVWCWATARSTVPETRHPVRREAIESQGFKEKSKIHCGPKRATGNTTTSISTIPSTMNTAHCLVRSSPAATLSPTMPPPLSDHRVGAARKA